MPKKERTIERPECPADRRTREAQAEHERERQEWLATLDPRQRAGGEWSLDPQTP
ncbi:hypothetical protein [Mesoterricola sediminis]|uniref:Uncharacterized protein n=1 Tax=Mesoterricola sediminis TaxID=2927980 RepID=A0AA48KFC5_9BACT|nr:hypothetical protein [Mesoterricola sediminis]BDU76313.1 hypothetical protein METESE_12710 [Mesoterricola sediminis]